MRPSRRLRDRHPGNRNRLGPRRADIHHQAVASRLDAKHLDARTLPRRAGRAHVLQKRPGLPGFPGIGGVIDKNRREQGIQLITRPTAERDIQRRVKIHRRLALRNLHAPCCRLGRWHPYGPHGKPGHRGQNQQ
jgi:hypothetical protein